MNRRPARPCGVKPVRLDVAALLSERRAIRRNLRARGVRPEDADDVAEDVIVAAWLAASADQYTPDPRLPARDALRRWLHGIASNLASHYRESARVRREVVTSPDAFPVQLGVDVEAQVAAREALAVVRSLPPGQRHALAVVADGGTFADVGAVLDVPASTAAKRFYRARAALFRCISAGQVIAPDNLSKLL